MNKVDTRRIKQLEKSIKKAMRDLPPGEHWHVVTLLAQQSAEIVELKHRIRAARKTARCGR